MSEFKYKKSGKKVKTTLRNQVSHESKKMLRAIMLYRSHNMGISLTMEQTIALIYKDEDLPEEYKVPREELKQGDSAIY